VPYGTTVLACHVGFDEVLTVGWNLDLANRLRMDIVDATRETEAAEVSDGKPVCIKGYKGDPDRRIGVVGRVVDGSTTIDEFRTSVIKEFEIGREEAAVQCFGDEDINAEIKTIAIMNAFHAEEVDRAVEAAVSRGWIENGQTLAYVTGEAREQGLAAAKEKGIKVFCVGHRLCEEWGIRFLAEELRKEFVPSGVEVVEVLEEEEERPRPPQKILEFVESAPK
jgi:putative NIF3 family GTP cyclohydrolase 1 type 2